MKTRRKILITIFAIVLLHVVIVEVDNFFNGSLHQTSIRPSGDNPNECWYQVDDGSIIPCKMQPYNFGYAVTMGWVLFGPYIVLGIVIVIIFILWRKRK